MHEWQVVFFSGMLLGAVAFWCGTRFYNMFRKR